MGWLWSSSPSSADNNDNDHAVSTITQPRPDIQPDLIKPTANTTPEQKRRWFFNQSDPTQHDGKQRDEDMESFLNSLTAQDSRAASSIQIQPDPTADAPSKNVVESHRRFLPDGSTNIHPEVLLPHTMSCREAFDQAFYCQSLGGKFNDIYRYGKLQSCSEQWGAFWFCMRTRTLSAEERASRIRSYYAEREKRKVKEAGGSSEDVWDLRTVGIRRAFHLDPDAEGSHDAPVP